MKYFIILLVSLFIPNTNFAQLNSLLHHKSNITNSIILKPGEYVGNDKNVEWLVISSEKRDTVYSPVTGIIYNVYYLKNNSFSENSVFEVKTNDDLENKKNIISEHFHKDFSIIDQLSLLVRIKLNDGTLLNVSGLELYKKFKTGSKINKGDIIGFVNYFYNKKFSQPSIAISISKNGKIINPAIFFSLNSNTTYQPNSNKIQKHIISEKEKIIDLKILKQSLEEGYPGLYDYNSKQSIDSIFEAKSKEINHYTTEYEFFKIIYNLLNKLKDNHIFILNYQECIDKKITLKDSYHSSVYFGWLNDTVVITRAIVKDTNFIGRKVISIDGIPVDTIKQYLDNFIDSDGNIESYKKFKLLTFGSLRYFDFYPSSDLKHNLTLVFANGDTIYFKGYINNNNQCVYKYPSWREYYIFPESNLSFQIFDNKSAYLSLKSFDFNDIEKDSINYFFNKIDSLKIDNLIIDVRNNRGGLTENIAFLMNYIADTTYKIELYSMVNKKSFDFFKYTLNYNKEMPNLFSEYNSQKQKKGFFYYDTTMYHPKKDFNFDGHLYVLTSERTFSASAIFAGLIKKHKLGVTVGRETKSTFHQLNAEKFANLILPYSKIKIRMPLVKFVFDTLSKKNINYGRGVIPDYHVNLSLSELSMENGDVILNYVQSLINKNIYITQKSAKIKSHIKHSVSNSYQLILLFLLFILIIFFVLIKIIYLSYVKK